MIKKNTAKNLFLFVFILLINQIHSQEYVKNIRIAQTGDKIQILYDLKVENKKNYIDPKNRVKSRRFHVTLRYSSDNGKTYQPITKTSGDIGKAVFQGKDRKIVCEPMESKYGMIGKYKFIIDANPKIPKISFGLTYCHNILNGGDLDSARINEFRFNIYKPIGHTSSSLMITLGFITANGTYNRKSEYSYTKYSHWKSNNIAITLGGGIQLFKRWISVFIGGGPMFEKLHISEQTFNDDGSIEFEKYTVNNVWGVLQTGIQIKIIDTRLLTILLPVNLFISPADGDFISLSSGLSLQF